MNTLSAFAVNYKIAVIRVHASNYIDNFIKYSGESHK